MAEGVSTPWQFLQATTAGFHFPLGINHIFRFLYFDVLTCGALLTLGGLPLPGWTNSCKHSLQIQTNQSRLHNPATSSLWLSHSRPLSICPNHPRLRYQTTREAPVAQSLWDNSNEPSLNLLTQPHPFLPVETTIKALSCPPLLLLASPSPPRRMCSLLSGTVSNKLPFQWQLFPDMLALLYLK